MCEILISIHPEFVDKIMNGQKKFEFRKVKTKKTPNKIIIYSTSPISLVVGEAEVEETLVDAPDKIWSLTEEYSGIEKNYFIEYFENKELAIAYKLKNVKMYDTPKKLSDFGLACAPQSFVYLQ